MNPEQQLSLFATPSTDAHSPEEEPEKTRGKVRETLGQKRTAFQQLAQQGWVIIRDEMVPVHHWQQWRACAVWPEPVTTDPETTWAIIDCAGYDNMDAGLPLRFGLARSPSTDALTIPDDVRSGRGAAEWSWGTYWTPLHAVGRVPEQYSRAIVSHFYAILRDAPRRFGSQLLEQMSHHMAKESFGEVMARWAFNDRWGNGFLRTLNGYLGPMPPAIDEALHAYANNPWHERALRTDAMAWLCGQALQDTAPQPWHWPPWAPEGQPIPDPRDALAPKRRQTVQQETIFDALAPADPDTADLELD